MSTVVVLGAGLAGTAVSWTLARQGARVVVVSRGSGATHQSSGAWDWQPWPTTEAGRAALGDRAAIEACPDETPTLPRHLQQEVDTFLGALGGVRRGTPWCWVATGEGLIRPCAARDSHVLDLGSVAGTTVAVDHPLSARARLFARSLAAQPWARATNTLFVPADELGKSGPAARLLMSPGHCTQHVNQEAPLQPPNGEALSGPAGPAGERLGVACARLLHESGVTVVQGRGRITGNEGGRVRVSVVDGTRERFFEGEHCVVAAGGLVGGGLRLDSGRGPGGAWGGSWWDGETRQPSAGLDGFDPLERAQEWLGARRFALDSLRLDRMTAVGPFEGVVLVGDALPAAPGTLFGAAASALAAGLALGSAGVLG